MDIFLHNTLGNKKEKFEPITAGKVLMYNCGPTVYNYAHIGNLRTYILNDLLRRMFEYNSLEVKQVMNITDVDDKTIKRSQDEGISLKALTGKYEQTFLSDLMSLNILPATKNPRATESIPEMVDLINKLLEKNIAYKSSDGIYFDISKSDDYGKLANIDLQKISKERIVNDEYDKENARDFALWKFQTESDGDVVFDALFGKGRPGWHIECSAMCMRDLGERIDVHTGGSDLIFPHHTNEIAQSEAITGKPLANFWVHGGFITVDSKKMSKSLGNVFTLDDLREKNIDPIAFRYFVLGAHYSTLLNFTWEALEGAEIAWKKLKAFVSRAPLDTDSEKSDQNKIEEYKNIFSKYINDDLDMPKALALIWEIVKDEKMNFSDKKDLILNFDKVLGLKLDEKEEEIEISNEIKNLISARDTARSEKNWKLSDELRDQIESLGFEVMDTDIGTKVSKRY